MSAISLSAVLPLSGDALEKAVGEFIMEYGASDYRVLICSDAQAHALPLVETENESGALGRIVLLQLPEAMLGDTWAISNENLENFVYSSL